MNDFENVKDAFEMAEILEDEFEDEKDQRLSIRVFDINTDKEIDVVFAFTNGDLDLVTAEIL